MKQIFKTDRSPAGFNLWVNRDEDGKLHIAVDDGRSALTIMLTDSEAESFIRAIAAQPPETQADGIPPHELSSCGTAYLASERALRIIENATKLGEALSADAIANIETLAHEAGAACNRLALKRDPFAEDIPF